MIQLRTRTNDRRAWVPMEKRTHVRNVQQYSMNMYMYVYTRIYICIYMYKHVRLTAPGARRAAPGALRGARGMASAARRAPRSPPRTKKLVSRAQAEKALMPWNNGKNKKWNAKFHFTFLQTRITHSTFLQTSKTKKWNAKSKLKPMVLNTFLIPLFRSKKMEWPSARKQKSGMPVSSETCCFDRGCLRPLNALSKR